MAYVFTELDPLRPTTAHQALADLLWRIDGPQVQSAGQVLECIALADLAFLAHGALLVEDVELPEHQAIFASHICLRQYTAQASELRLMSGAIVTVRDVLAAVALMQIDRAARAIRSGNAATVAAYMADLCFYMYIAGYEHGEDDETQRQKGRVSELSRQAAEAAHRENRALREEVVRAYRENHERWGSKNVAAKELAKLVPLKPRTIRDLLQEIDPEWWFDSDY